jgi:hypothetical protein
MGLLLHRLRRSPARDMGLAETLLAHATVLAAQVARLAQATRALDAREAALVAREAALERALLEESEALDERRAALEALAAELREREARLAGREAALAECAAALATPPADPDRSLLFIATPGGYRLVERDAPPPPPGTALDLDGEIVVVRRLGPSPLPGDRRRCALVEPLVGGRNEATGAELRAS